MKTTTQIKKWGNSLAVRIPGRVARDLGIYNAATVVFVSDESGFSVRVLKESKPSLEELVDKITPENSPETADWGKPVGKEVW